jgi:hypothetical protein
MFEINPRNLHFSKQKDYLPCHETTHEILRHFNKERQTARVKKDFSLFSG